MSQASKFIKRIADTLSFFFFYCFEVVLSNFRVAYDILTPEHTMKPGIIAIPLPGGLTDVQLIMLANLITMTPGTLSLDISRNRRKIYIHVMFLDTPEKFRKLIQENYVRRIQRVF